MTRAKGAAKPAGSEQRAAIRTRDYKTESSKKLTPSLGFPKFSFPYCTLLTAICILVFLCGGWRRRKRAVDNAQAIDPFSNSRFMLDTISKKIVRKDEPSRSSSFSSCFALN